MALSKEPTSEMHSFDMITNEELTLILNKYSLGELSSPIEQITDGWVNLTFKFQAKPYNKIYILREYLPNTEKTTLLENIQVELNFISYLYKQFHLPVVPMVDPPGIFLLNNGHYCAIFPFINGIKYINTPENPVRQLWQTIEISKFLGQMHSIEQRDLNLVSKRQTVNFVDTKYQLVRLCDEFDKDYPDLYKRIHHIIDEHTQLIPLIETECEQILFEESFEKNLPKGFIHVDIHDENVLFYYNQNKIAAVLDFDDMSFGPFLIDIAMTICFWCLRGSTFDINYVKQFLIEYQNGRNLLLTNDEWNLLELYCYMAMLHQILFTIRSKDSGRVIDEIINQLLLPIEQISRDRMFLQNIR